MISNNVERRFARRINANIDSCMIAGNKSYKGSIENISLIGLEYIIRTSSLNMDGLYQEKSVNIYIMTHTGESLSLPCKIKWLAKKWPAEKFLRLGLQIQSYGQQFEALMDILDIVNMN